MPIYEYACGACGHHFEEWQKMSDKPVRTCPKCKAKKVEKLISQTSFTLKGGGWYSDLYAGPKPAGAAKDSSAGASSDASGTAKESKETKETKPDASATSGTSGNTSSGTKAAGDKPNKTKKPGAA
jgi:putative FmdB family regulatory protein